MNKIHTLAALLALVMAPSCDAPNGLEVPKTTTTPGSIENIRVDNSKAGQMILHWDRVNQEGQETLYVRVKYNDPYLGKDVIRFGSFQGDSVVIPG